MYESINNTKQLENPYFAVMSTCERQRQVITERMICGRVLNSPEVYYLDQK